MVLMDKQNSIKLIEHLLIKVTVSVLSWSKYTFGMAMATGFSSCLNQLVMDKMMETATGV